MAKDPFASMSDELPNPGLREKFSVGRVLTGVVVIAAVTFGLAYYVPLNNAHSALAQAHESLTSSNAGTSVQLEKTTQQLMQTQKEREEAVAELKAVADAKTAAQQAVSSLAEQVKQKLEKLIAGKAVQVTADEHSVVVLIDDEKLFRAHQVSVHPPGRKLLCAVSAGLKDAEGQIQVGGHTSGAEVLLPALKIDYPTVWEVSSARAVGAVRVLESCGVSGTRLQAIGFAQHRPNPGVPKESLGQLTLRMVPDAAR